MPNPSLNFRAPAAFLTRLERAAKADNRTIGSYIINACERQFHADAALRVDRDADKPSSTRKRRKAS